MNFSLPDFYYAVSRRSNYKALSRLEGGYVCDDVMVAHGQGLRASTWDILGGTTLLLTVDLLVKIKGIKCFKCKNTRTQMMKIFWKMKGSNLDNFCPFDDLAIVEYRGAM